MDKKEIQKAKNNFDEILKDAKFSNNRSKLEKIERHFKSLGSALYKQNLDKEALKYFNLCLDIHKSLLPPINKHTADLLLRIGNAHYRLKDNENAERFF